MAYIIYVGLLVLYCPTMIQIKWEPASEFHSNTSQSITILYIYMELSNSWLSLHPWNLFQILVRMKSAPVDENQYLVWSNWSLCPYWSEFLISNFIDEKRQCIKIYQSIDHNPQKRSIYKGNNEEKGLIETSAVGVMLS